MRRSWRLAVPTMLALCVASWVGIGRAQQEGAAEKAGEKLDNVGRKIKKGLEKAEDAVREGFHRTRESVHGMGVVARVYGRLHWDKALHTSPLTIRVEDGALVLRGAVPNAAAKARAVDLAADTVGVTKVVDELTLPASEAETSRGPAKP
jgi:hyperosmotically inducible periplasmic protein